MIFTDQEFSTDSESEPTKPSFVGPHEGQELQRMLAETKPLSMFLVPIDTEFEYFREAEFDRFVAEGRFVKSVCMVLIKDPIGNDVKFRRVLYALRDEEWRIKAFSLVQGLYDESGPGWRPDLDRLIGRLLGYDQSDIEGFITWIGRSRK